MFSLLYISLLRYSLLYIFHYTDVYWPDRGQYTTGLIEPYGYAYVYVGSFPGVCCKCRSLMWSEHLLSGLVCQTILQINIYHPVGDIMKGHYKLHIKCNVSMCYARFSPNIIVPNEPHGGYSLNLGLVLFSSEISLRHGNRKTTFQYN